jgi:selenophosphate synthase
LGSDVHVKTIAIAITVPDGSAHEVTGGAARSAGAAKLIENAHSIEAKQEGYGLAVVGRNVIERDFARTGSRHFIFVRKGKYV